MPSRRKMHRKRSTKRHTRRRSTRRMSRSNNLMEMVENGVGVGI